MRAFLGESRRSAHRRGDSMMIQLDDGTQHLMSLLTHVPPMAARHLHDQAPHVQPLEQPAHRMALTVALAGILGGLVQRRPDVGVAEAVQQVLTDEHRTILFSSHNTLDVEQISDRIAFIDRGRLIALEEKEDLLDRWRRIRLLVPPSAVLPQLPGVVEVGGSERLPVLTTSQFNPAVVSLCQDRGASVQSVDPMTLEEIFVANVQSRRELQPA